jgi:hypothetical protein
MNRTSPFSAENEYEALTVSRKLAIMQLMTPRESVFWGIIQSCGTVAGFQVEHLWPADGRKQLKRAAARGIIVRHRLDGRRKLNVYSLDVRFDLDQALRQIHFAQLYLRIREVTPCSAAVVPAPLTGVLKFNGKLFPVVVLRKRDRTPLLANLPRLIVVSENRDVSLPDIDYRLTTDLDLLYNPMVKAFYRPDGTSDPFILVDVAGTTM